MKIYRTIHGQKVVFELSNNEMQNAFAEKLTNMMNKDAREKMIQLIKQVEKKPHSKDMFNFLQEHYNITKNELMSPSYIKETILPSAIDALNLDAILSDVINDELKLCLTMFENMYELYKHDSNFDMSLFIKTDEMSIAEHYGIYSQIYTHAKSITEDLIKENLINDTSLLDSNNKFYATIFLTDIINMIDILNIKCDDNTLKTIALIAIQTAAYDQHYQNKDIETIRKYTNNYQLDESIISKTRRNYVIISLCSFLMLSEKLKMSIEQLSQILYQQNVIAAFNLFNTHSVFGFINTDNGDVIKPLSIKLTKTNNKEFNMEIRSISNIIDTTILCHINMDNKTEFHKNIIQTINNSLNTIKHKIENTIFNCNTEDNEPNENYNVDCNDSFNEFESDCYFCTKIENDDNRFDEFDGNIHEYRFDTNTSDCIPEIEDNEIIKGLIQNGRIDTSKIIQTFIENNFEITIHKNNAGDIEFVASKNISNFDENNQFDESDEITPEFCEFSFCIEEVNEPEINDSETEL